VDGTLPAGARHDLTDEQWAILASLLEALLPVGQKPGRPRKWTLRQLIDGIRFRTRTGCPWRDVPERYGTWQSVYGLFRAWQLAGTWAVIVSALQAMSAEAGSIEWVVSVDSTINRAHSHAAGARRHPEAQRTPPAGEPPDHALGRSRGGLSTKVHLAVEQRRKTLATALTPGQAADSPQFTTVLGRIRVPRRSGPGRPRTRPTRVLVDKALLGPGQPDLSPPPRYPGDHSDQGQPAGQPAQEGLGRRATADLRPGPLPAAACRRVRHQPAQTAPWLRHPLRQARRPLRGHRPDQRHLPLAARPFKQGLGLPALADKGYDDAGAGIHTPVKGGGLHPDTAARNELIGCLRAQGERGIALLKTRWKALRRIRLCPQRIGAVVAAALVLTTLERPIR
jgi:transposase